MMRPSNVPDGGGCLRLVALFPHPSIAALLYRRQKELYRAGFLGAFSFPPAAPFAKVSRPLTAAELKKAAGLLRAGLAGREAWEGAVRQKKSGRFTIGAPDSVGLFPPYSICGPRLDCPALVLPEDAGAERFSRIILALTLARDIPPPEALACPALPAHCRAAALANIALYPLDSPFSFAWKLSAPIWLPPL